MGAERPWPLHGEPQQVPFDDRLAARLRRWWRRHVKGRDPAACAKCGHHHSHHDLTGQNLRGIPCLMCPNGFCLTDGPAVVLGEEGSS